MKPNPLLIIGGVILLVALLSGTLFKKETTASTLDYLKNNCYYGAKIWKQTTSSGACAMMDMYCLDDPSKPCSQVFYNGNSGCGYTNLVYTCPKSTLQVCQESHTNCQSFSQNICVHDSTGYYSCQGNGAYGDMVVEQGYIRTDYFCNMNIMNDFVKCADGETCSDGLCGGTVKVCTPNFQVCSDGSDFDTYDPTGDVYKCNSEGSGWNLLDSCSGDQACVEVLSTLNSTCVYSNTVYCKRNDHTCYSWSGSGNAPSNCYDTLQECNDEKCDFDGDCESSIGENLDNCPSDCTCVGEYTQDCTIENCDGVRSRECNAGVWGAWSSCLKAADCCIGEASKQCTASVGTVLCAGTQTRECNAGVWSYWGACIKSEPNCPGCSGASNQSCSVGTCSGTQSRTCVNQGVWGPWGDCSCGGACGIKPTVKDWSTCLNATQTRTNYTCNASQWQAFTEKQACSKGFCIEFFNTYLGSTFGGCQNATIAALAIIFLLVMLLTSKKGRY